MWNIPGWHDLGELLALVRTHYPDLIFQTEDLLELSPYAVEARYDTAWAPEVKEAQQALDRAAQVHELVARAIEAN